MTITPDGASLPQLALLACVSWYLNILTSESTDGASAAVVVAMV
jgi:hypothetical protein